MSKILRHDQKIGAAISEAVTEHIDKAIAVIDDDQSSLEEKIHETRKRCKNIRAILRLVRDGLGDYYYAENAWYRDVARRISEARDADVMVESIDDLAEWDAERSGGETDITSVRRWLDERRDRLHETQNDMTGPLARARGELEVGRGRLENWSVKGKGFRPIRAGLKRAYRRGRKAFFVALKTGRSEDYHQWRKRVKYHWRHCLFLENAWPAAMTVRSEQLKQLSDYLGDDHDLAIVTGTLETEGGPDGDRRHAEKTVGLARRRREELQREARILGARLYAEKPKRFIKRLQKYWEAYEAGAAEAE